MADVATPSTWMVATVSIASVTAQPAMGASEIPAEIPVEIPAEIPAEILGKNHYIQMENSPWHHPTAGRWEREKGQRSSLMAEKLLIFLQELCRILVFAQCRWKGWGSLELSEVLRAGWGWEGLALSFKVGFAS